MDIKYELYFVLPFVLTAAISLVGLLLLSVSYRAKKRSGQIEIENWSIAGGKVLSLHLINSQPDAAAGNGETYDPLVEYVYVVDDAEYRGNRVFPGKSASLTRTAAQEILDKYPLNSFVPVRYNPEDPSESALEAESPRMTRVNTLGWIFTGFGVCACCFTTFMGLIILGGIQ
jgi:hypothetical protein